MKKVIVVVGLVISFIFIGLGVYGLVLSKQQNVPINKEETNNLDVLKQSIEMIKNINNFSNEFNVTTNKPEQNTNITYKIDLGTKQSEILMIENEITTSHSYTVLENGNLVNYLSLGTKDYLKTSQIENDSSSTFDRTRYEVLINNIYL